MLCLLELHFLGQGRWGIDDSFIAHRDLTCPPAGSMLHKSPFADNHFGQFFAAQLGMIGGSLGRQLEGCIVHGGTAGANDHVRTGNRAHMQPEIARMG